MASAKTWQRGLVISALILFAAIGAEWEKTKPSTPGELSVRQSQFCAATPEETRQWQAFGKDAADLQKAAEQLCERAQRGEIAMSRQEAIDSVKFAWRASHGR